MQIHLLLTTIIIFIIPVRLRKKARKLIVKRWLIHYMTDAYNYSLARAKSTAR